MCEGYGSRVLLGCFSWTNFRRVTKLESGFEKPTLGARGLWVLIFLYYMSTVNCYFQPFFNCHIVSSQALYFLWNTRVYIWQEQQVNITGLESDMGYQQNPESIWKATFDDSGDAVIGSYSSWLVNSILLNNVFNHLGILFG